MGTNRSLSGDRTGAGALIQISTRPDKGVSEKQRPTQLELDSTRRFRLRLRSTRALGLRPFNGLEPFQLLTPLVSMTAPRPTSRRLDLNAGGSSSATRTHQRPSILQRPVWLLPARDTTRTRFPFTARRFRRLPLAPLLHVLPLAPLKSHSSLPSRWLIGQLSPHCQPRSRRDMKIGAGRTQPPAPIPLAGTLAGKPFSASETGAARFGCKDRRSSREEPRAWPA